ncbi:hypothetical protein CAPTEDRAFT_21960 [Capitella teleta]|uniref:Dehydrogenase/reductase SDR family member 11 n=1 Tax=Capitella teleta TaxID=283909 RepID=R7UQQ9_CAPTE|nr:hypothetical protein CAPTEDRAFT_21960 [Capitella teleta]|eukprot:ELU08443.1 hypothetical protein CAPTEDRAFT_21960 [Capitella teleta]
MNYNTNMERWQGRVALVTGGSSGVGMATVIALVKQGMKVATCARSMDKLAQLSLDLKAEKGSLLPIHCDLRNEAEIMKMFETIAAQWGGVDVLVNNAGLALDSWIIDGDSEPWRNMIDVNILAPCLCARESVKSMRSRDVNDGHVINLNSMSGHRVGKLHFYSVTKFATQAITDAIRWELRGIQSGIKVSEISPGLIKSNFHKIAYDSQEKADEVYRNGAPLSPDDIAEIVVYLLSTPSHVQVHDILVRHVHQIP